MKLRWQLGKVVAVAVAEGEGAKCPEKMRRRTAAVRMEEEKREGIWNWVAASGVRGIRFDSGSGDGCAFEG